MVINDLERIWNEAVVVQSKYYPDICVEKLGKTTKTLCEDGKSPGRDLDQRPPENTSTVLLEYQPALCL